MILKIIMKQNLRWYQRLTNFELALNELTDAIHIANQRKLNKLEEQGLIQVFEYNYELAWNCIKDYLENQGDTGISGSRDAFRLAFKRGLIEHGECWLQMIQSRISTSHTYHKEAAHSISKRIISDGKNIF